MALESTLLKSVTGITHGFGTALDPVPSFISNEWETLKPVWKQVHGIAVGQVTHSGQNMGEVDALWSQSPGTLVAVQTADCVPILLATRDGRAAAAVHAGWRGTFARILPALFETLRSKGYTAKDWVAAIGPSIGPCCYEVSNELEKDFRQNFGTLGFDLMPEGSRRLNLVHINEQELQRLGVSQIDRVSPCTQCSTSVPLHSYRREGTGKRQWSVIKLQTK